MSKKGNTPSFIQVLKSTLAAAFGVQSSRNREEDFASNSIMPYIAAGIIFTLIFIATLSGIAYLVLSAVEKT